MEPGLPGSGMTLEPGEPGTVVVMAPRKPGRTVQLLPGKTCRVSIELGRICCLTLSRLIQAPMLHQQVLFARSCSSSPLGTLARH